MCVNVQRHTTRRRNKTLRADANYMLLTVVVTGHNCVAVRRNATCCTNQAELDLCGMLRPSTYDDALCVNAVVEMCSITTRCRTSTYSDARLRTQCERGFNDSRLLQVIKYAYSLLLVY